jgi:hypothetical protein
LKIKIISAKPNYWYYKFVGEKFTINMNTIQFDTLYGDYRCDVAEENYDEFSKKYKIQRVLPDTGSRKNGSYGNDNVVAILLRNTNYKAIIRKKKLNEILHNQHEV